MGSQPLLAAEAESQHALPPFVARSAACPYFSLITCLMSGLPTLPLSTYLNYGFRFDSLVSAAALRVKEPQKLPQCFSVSCVVQERALPPNLNKTFVLKLVEVVGKSRVWDVEFFLNFPDDKAVWMGRKQELHDSESGFGAHGREHVSVLGHLLHGLLRGSSRFHISMIVEIWARVKRMRVGPMMALKAELCSPEETLYS